MLTESDPIKQIKKEQTENWQGQNSCTALPCPQCETFGYLVQRQVEPCHGT